MSRLIAVVFLGGIMLAAMLASWPAGGSVAFDCRTITPTPTISPTPTPTPPWEPYSWVPICNDTGQAVSDLHVILSRSAANADPFGANAPGCPEPSFFYGGSSTSYTSISIDWGTPCVQPGEMVALYFFAGCTNDVPGCSVPHASCYYWTADGQPVPSESPAVNPWRCASPSPIATATPGTPKPCEARGTPPVTYAPTPTPSSPTPTPGPTSRDAILMTTIPFCNDADLAASDLHVRFGLPYSGRTFKANPSGCPEPSFEPAQYGLDTFDLDVDWGVDCVDPGESLTLEFTYACGDVPCNTPQPFCFTWTRFGEPVYQGEGDCILPTPTPTPTPTGPTPTPTPTPPVDVSVWSFLNNTGQAASDLHARFNGPFLARLVSNAPGCPDPALAHQTYSFEFDLDWGVSCVDAGESVSVEITSEPPVHRSCAYWTLLGEPLVAPGGCPSPGDIDCDGGVDSVDALRDLRFVAGLPLNLPQGCDFRGDIECDGDIESTDALGILRYVAGLPALPQNEPCPDIGLVTG